MTSWTHAHTINTQRCVLRALAPSDVTTRYVSWLNNPDVNRYLEARWKRHTRETVRENVRYFLDSPRHMLFGIFTESQEIHIGNVKLSEVDFRYGTAEIGFLIGESSFWGKGYASEAIGAVCHWAFGKGGIQKVSAGAYAQNIASRKTLEKVGFAQEGVLRSQVVLDSGERSDVIRFGLLSGRKEMLRL